MLERILDVLEGDETALIIEESISTSLWTEPRTRETGRHGAGGTYLLEKLHHEVEERAPRLVPVVYSLCYNAAQLF